MNAASWLMIAIALGTVLVTLQPRLMQLPLWRATVTPLASIIGSGFLVAGPILSHAAGRHAWIAMLALCAVGWLFGMAIRHNIAGAEPLLARPQPPRGVLLLERASDLALSFSYFISVAYYLNLFAAFGLRIGGVIDDTAIRLVSTAVIALLGLTGAMRGLRGLEKLEEAAVGLKLALIAGLLAALLLGVGQRLAAGMPLAPPILHDTGWHEIGILLGLVIMVQGFETSRYLGHAYDGPLRIRTMRYAQILSTAIYMAFILLATPWFTGRLPKLGGETGIIDMLAPLGVAIGPLIIVTALASQLSAAVADTAGAGGLLHGASGRRIPVRLAYLGIAAVAVAVTWSANIFEIITWASKAFVLYYGLQAALAAHIALRPAEGIAKPGPALLFAGAALLAVVIIVFGIPAEGAG